jgi:hypothetical protein
MGGRYFTCGISRLCCENDPSLALRGGITSPQRQHYKPLPLSEIPEFKRRLRAYSGRAETIISPRLLLILWVLPGQLRRAHIVPLPYQAVELLQELQTCTGRLTCLFVNTRRFTTCRSRP